MIDRSQVSESHADDDDDVSHLSHKITRPKFWRQEEYDVIAPIKLRNPALFFCQEVFVWRSQFLGKINTDVR